MNTSAEKNKNTEPPLLQWNTKDKNRKKKHLLSKEQLFDWLISQQQ